jgi:protein-disulfide isomerase
MRLMCLCAAVLAGCATMGAAPMAVDEGPTPVVAKFGGRLIRQAEVDAKVADELSKLEEQLFELRAEAAERIAIEALVQSEAKKAGLTEEAWLGQHVESGLVEPTEADMKSMYEKARSRIPAHVSYDDVKPQLRMALQRESRAKKAKEVFGELKKGAGYALVLAPPVRPRKTLDQSGPSRGAADAEVVIVEFADFECPYCSRAHETVQAVLNTYKEKVRIVFRHYPLSFHLKAPKAAEATLCAGEQGKFWELHDALFESQEIEVEALKLQAKRAGLDEARFDACLDSGKTAELVKRDMQEGQRVGVTGTPAFFINGLMLTGAQSEESFQKIIDSELERLSRN